MDLRPAPPLEIAFLERHGLDRDKLLLAAEIADGLGVCADAVLLEQGWMSEKEFYASLAREISVPYYDGRFGADPRTELDAAILQGFARLAPNERAVRAVVAPRGQALKLLLESARKSADPLPIAIASRQRLSSCLRAQFGDSVASRAANLVADRDPALSAKMGASPWQIVLAVAIAAGVAAGVAYAPMTLRVVLSLVFWTIFSAAVWLRSMAVAAHGHAGEVGRTGGRVRALPDEDLPVYTVIAAIYKEARVVPQLVKSLEELDYPRAKLDIKIVIEHEDRETAAALAALRLPARFDVIVAPRGAPRTKPRALNIALAAARGELVTVFDAEDRPAPGQLRAAASYFATADSADCLQARLVIENSSDSWLSYMYAIEYAVLFDIFNPGLAALRLPIALGGTSNHFRVEALKRAGGWDAWNVTEDADLGIRWARLGMRIDTLRSDTIEEAPHEFGNWFRQRVRWQKGWMQTFLVHSRNPLRLYRQLGGWGTLSAAALIGGGLSGGLFGTAFFAETLARMFAAAFIPGYANYWYGDIVTIGLLLWGVQTLVVPAALAMRARRLNGLTRALLTMPFYFALISATSWNALFDLIFRPYHWHKTEHGREKTRGALEAVEAALFGAE